MMKTPYWQHQAFQFAVAGIILAFGAPCGWYVLTEILGVSASSFHFYIYAGVSTTIVFGLFGFTLGYYNSKVIKLSQEDSLTGLFNQRSFLSIADKLREYLGRNHKPAAVVMIDIDHFKKVNDEHDHFFGNHVIQRLSNILRQECRHSDVLARFGGDEFVLFLPDTSGEKARVFCNRVANLVSDYEFIHGDHRRHITLSIGIADCFDSRTTLSKMLTDADSALYASKQNGRAQVSIFSGRQQKKKKEKEKKAKKAS